MWVVFVRWTNLSVTEEGELWWSHSKPHAYPPEFSGHARQKGWLSSQRRRRNIWSWGVSLGSVYPSSWGTDNSRNYSLCIIQGVKNKHHSSAAQNLRVWFWFWSDTCSTKFFAGAPLGLLLGVGVCWILATRSGIRGRACSRTVNLQHFFQYQSSLLLKEKKNQDIK